MKSGKERQAEHTTRLKFLGLRQVAVWVSDTESWLVNQASAGAKADRLMTAHEYMGRLVDRSRKEMLDTFLADGGTMAVFEAERDGRRKAVGAKVVRFRTLPILMTYPLTEDTHERELFDAHPLLARIHEGIGDYHWDTPAFRETCFAMQIPPDEVRPVFRAPYAELASALLAGCAGRFGKEEMTEEAPIGQTTAIIYDLLDLMREDLRPNPSLLNRVREHWPKMALDRLPHAEDLTRLVHSDELLRISEAQHRANDGIGMQGTSIDFLPSRHGGGYSATISGFWGEYDAEGWVAGAYDDLHGVAVEPEPERLEASAWLRVVRRRLPEQGVIFIPRDKVRSYLDTEGAYWIERHGGTGKWHQARKPSFGERMLWRLKPPPMPLDRELALRELARRGTEP